MTTYKYIDDVKYSKAKYFNEHRNLGVEENRKYREKDEWDNFHGKQIRCYDNGQIKEETNYKDGKLVGVAKWYNISGDIIAKMTYKDGSPWSGTYLEFETTYDGEEDIKEYIYKKGNLVGEIKITFLVPYLAKAKGYKKVMSHTFYDYYRNVEKVDRYIYKDDKWVKSKEMDA